MSQPNNMTTPLPPSTLPYGQLESLRSKITQMIDSIQTLQRTVEGPSGAGYPYMPAWPDILSKYTMLLSQSHNLSMSLVNSYAIRANGGGGAGGGGTSGNPYERLALHPSVVMSDAQLDNEVIPLLRNQQTTDVLKLENETVRHLAEHMLTRGSLGVLGVSSSSSSTTTTGSTGKAGVLVRDEGGMGMGRKIEYTDVLSECEQIRAEHDERIERAVNAVVRLRNEKYEWKVRVAVEQEEPEELEWDPRLALPGGGGGGGINGKGEEEGREEEEMNVDEGEGEESNDSEEEEELEEVLGNGEESGEGTPVPEPMVEG